MDILLKRDNAFTLFKNINTAILNNYVQLKNQYKQLSPPSNQIINCLKTWKESLQVTIKYQILKVLRQEEMPQGLTQTQVITFITENYKEQQEFIELFRNLHSSIETIKDFIRTNAFKDTSKDSVSN